MEAVDEIAPALDLTVQRRLGGTWGAYLVSTPAGATAVLKPLPRHEIFALPRLTTSVQLATELRSRGYPVPEYLDFGIVAGRTYTLQEFVAGDTPARLGVSQVRQLIELWRQHRDAATRAGIDGTRWRADLLTGIHAEAPALSGCDQPRVRRILDRSRAAVDRISPDVLRITDAAHGDFHHANLLVRGGKVVAYVDWEGSRAGDSRLDLLMLAFSSIGMRSVEPAARGDLLAEIRRAIPPDTRELLASWYAVGKVAYGLRTSPETLEWALGTAELMFDG